MGVVAVRGVDSRGWDMLQTAGLGGLWSQASKAHGEEADGFGNWEAGVGPNREALSGVAPGSVSRSHC